MNRTPLPQDAAKLVKSFLGEQGIEVNHGLALEITARAQGFANWQTLQAQLKNVPRGAARKNGFAQGTDEPATFDLNTVMQELVSAGNAFLPGFELMNGDIRSAAWDVERILRPSERAQLQDACHFIGAVTADFATQRVCTFVKVDKELDCASVLRIWAELSSAARPKLTYRAFWYFSSKDGPQSEMTTTSDTLPEAMRKLWKEYQASYIRHGYFDRRGKQTVRMPIDVIVEACSAKEFLGTSVDRVWLAITADGAVNLFDSQPTNYAMGIWTADHGDHGSPVMQLGLLPDSAYRCCWEVTKTSHTQLPAYAD